MILRLLIANGDRRALHISAGQSDSYALVFTDNMEDGGNFTFIRKAKSGNISAA